MQKIIFLIFIQKIVIRIANTLQIIVNYERKSKFIHEECKIFAFAKPQEENNFEHHVIINKVEWEKLKKEEWEKLKKDSRSTNKTIEQDTTSKSDNSKYVPGVARGETEEEQTPQPQDSNPILLSRIPLKEDSPEEVSPPSNKIKVSSIKEFFKRIFAVLSFSGNKIYQVLRSEFLNYLVDYLLDFLCDLHASIASRNCIEH